MSDPATPPVEQGGAPGDTPARARGVRWARWARRSVARLTAAAGALLALLLVLLLLVVGALQFDAVSTRMAGWVLNRVLPWPGAVATVRHVAVRGVGHVQVHELRIARPGAEPLVAVDTMDARLRLLRLVRGSLELPTLTLAGVRVVMTQRADSTWDLLAPLAADSAAPTDSSTLSVVLARAELRRGAFQARYRASRDSVLAVRDVLLRLDTLRWPAPLAVVVDTVDAWIVPPVPTGAPPARPARLAGALHLANGRMVTAGVSLRADSSHLQVVGSLALPDSGAAAEAIDVRVTAAPLHLRDVGALLPVAVPGPRLALDLHLTGSSASLGVQLAAATDRGGRVQLTGQLTPRAAGALRYVVQGQLRDLDLAQWMDSAPPLRGVDADLSLSLAGPTLDSLSGEARLEVLRGALADGRLERSRLDAALVAGNATIDLRGGAAPWGRVSARATTRPLDSIPAWELRATVSQLQALEAGALRVAQLVGRVRARGAGLSPATARGSARVALDAAVGDTRLHDGTLTAAWHDAGADVTMELPVGSGHVAARTQVAWGGEAPRLTVRSLSVRRLQLAELLGDTVAGRISAEGAGAMAAGAPQGATGAARVVLTDARWGRGGATLDSGVATLTVRQGEATGRAVLVASAGRVDVAARARPFDELSTWRVDSLRIVGLDLAAVDSTLPRSDVNALLQLAGRGTAPEAIRATGTLVLGASVLGGVRLDTAGVQLAAEDGTLEITGGGRLLGGAWSVAAGGEPFEATPRLRLTRLRFDSISIDSVVGAPVQATLSGTLVAQGALPPDTFPALTALLTLEAGQINGEPIDSATVEGRVAGDSARANAVLLMGQGRVHAGGVAALARDSAGMTIGALRGTATVDLPRVGWLFGRARDSVESGLQARVAVAGRGTEPRTLAWNVDGEARGRYGAARLDSLTIDARMDGGVLRVDTVAIASNVVRGGVGGWIPVFADAAVLDSSVESGVRLQLQGDSVAVLARLLGVEPLATRGMSLRATATRDEEAVLVRGELATGGMIAPSVAADTLRAELAAVLRDGRLTTATLDVEGRRLAASATTIERWEGRVEHDTVRTAFTSRAVLDARHEVRLAGTVSLADSTVHLDTLHVALPSRAWQLAAPADMRWGERLDPGGIALVSGASRIALEGVLDRRGTQSLALQLDSVPVGEFAELAGVRRLEGVVHGRVQVSGPADTVTLDGTVDGRINGTVAALTVRPADRGRLGVDVRLVDADGDSLRAEGTVPFGYSLVTARAPRPTDEVALDVNARAFSLEWITPLLSPLGVDRLQGEVTARVQLAGTLDAPRLTGSASLAGGTLLVPLEGVAYRSMQGDVAFRGDRMRITSLSAEAGGRAEVTGEVIMTPLDNPSLDLSLRLRRFQAVDNAWTRLRLNGTLAMRGPLSAPTVDGAVQLEGTDFYLDELETGVTATPVELTPADYAMLADYFGYTPGVRAETLGDPLLPWALGIRVDVGNDVWVRRRTSPELRVQLGGSLDVRKQPGDSIQLFGTMEAQTARSYFEQFGRRFALTTGTVTFNGPMTGWRVSAAARYEVPSSRDPSAAEAVITLDVTGGEDDLRLTLGAQPSMENADIISYLATGRPAASAVAFGNTSTEQGNGARNGVLSTGGQLALGRVASVLEETAQKAVGLDVVEIRQNGLEGATLVSGRYVNPRLFIGFQQPLTFTSGSDATRPDQGFRGTMVELEYTWYRWLTVNVRGGQSALRFFLRTRYAY